MGNLQVREDLKRGIFIENITEETTSNSEQAIDILRKGARNRHVGSTDMNAESSRSHSVFTMTIESKRTDSLGVTHLKSSKFHFVDLAGSERQKQTSTGGTRLKEAGNINKSLTVLGSVINSLVEVSQGKKKHINYRDSKLTFLLKDSLGGNSKTTMIANISPASINFSETLSTLKFAQRAKLIKNQASINEESSGSIEVLKAEICRLRKELETMKVRVPAEVASFETARRAPNSFSQEAIEEQQRALMELNKNQIDLETLLHEVSQEYEHAESRAKAEADKLSRVMSKVNKSSTIQQNKERQLRMMIDLCEEKIRKLSFNSWSEEDQRDSVVRENVGLCHAALPLRDRQRRAARHAGLPGKHRAVLQARCSWLVQQLRGRPPRAGQREEQSHPHAPRAQRENTGSLPVSPGQHLAAQSPPGQVPAALCLEIYVSGRDFARGAGVGRS